MLLKILHLVHPRLKCLLVESLVLLIILLQPRILLLQLTELLVHIVIVLAHLLHLVQHVVGGRSSNWELRGVSGLRGVLILGEPAYGGGGFLLLW